MEHTSTVTILTLALLTAPALASGISGPAEPPSTDVWRPADRLTPGTSGPSASTLSAEFGSSVAVDAGTAVVGAPGSSTVVVYERTLTGSWVEEAAVAPPTSVGRSVAVDEGTIVLGSVAGASAYVFEETDNGWTRTATLSGSDVDPSGGFGWDVAVDGDSIAVSALADDLPEAEDAGSLYVFQRDDSERRGWVEQARLTADDAREGDLLGWSVAVDGRNIVAGAPFDQDGPAVHVFSEESGGFTETILQPPEEVRSFGRSVAADSSRVVVGAPSAAPPEAYLFEERADGWASPVRLAPHDVSPWKKPQDFGSSVAVDAGTVLVGAPIDDRSPGVTASPSEASPPCIGLAVTETCSRAGASYVFKQDGTEWTQAAKLVPPDGLPGGEFGASASLSSGAALVGAPAWGESQASEPGAAYAFAEV